MFSNLDDKNKQSIKRKIFSSNLNLDDLNVSITKNIKLEKIKNV